MIGVVGGRAGEQGRERSGEGDDMLMCLALLVAMKALSLVFMRE